jgi:succinate dehydrogenase / fumarate reductase cytochrome b subunit
MALLAFLIVHIIHFRLKRGQFHSADGSVSGLGAEVVSILSNPLFAVIYIVGSMLVAWHIFHGFQSAFRSVGFNHKKYRPIVEAASAGIAGLIGLGFSLFPIAAQLNYFVQDAPAADEMQQDGSDAEQDAPAAADETQEDGGDEDSAAN